MSRVLNQEKLEQIRRRGQTADLPLFDQQAASFELPTRIHDAREISAIALQKMTDCLPERRLGVFLAIFQLGAPTDREIARHLDWEINQVTGRRKELQQMGLIREAGLKTGEHGLPNTTWMIDKHAMSLLLE